jgi:predicted GH43/DUF377 family glycosyl hydrolase
MLIAGCFIVCAALTAAGDDLFPPEMVSFKPYEGNPIFQAAGPGHWDEKIRERGWIMKEDGEYHMWYTGYDNPKGPMKLGYATSPDGISWKRYEGNPIYTEKWVEDMIVVKKDGVYYMFAEGVGDHAHLLSSTDRIHWTSLGNLDIRKKNGEPIPDGPYGTPAAFYENGLWYLMYERDDVAEWLATSKDMKVWTNVQDEPVINCGPESYDSKMIATNQIIKHNGKYYAYYHSTCPEYKGGWSMNVAVSSDLLHWTKYPKNPIVGPDFSSGIIVDDGEKLRFYCMHSAVSLFLPNK